MAVPAEFSRPVPLALLGREPFRQDIEAQPEERGALARRFGLVALDRLAAAVTLRREGGATILFEARFEADFTQDCVVSLEPVRAMICENFALRYGPPEAEPDDPDPAGEAPAFEPLAGEAIDIGEAVAQELSLRLPAAPRLPEARVEQAGVEAPPDGPFAALKRLAKD